MRHRLVIPITPSLQPLSSSPLLPPESCLLHPPVIRPPHRGDAGDHGDLSKQSTAHDANQSSSDVRILGKAAEMEIPPPRAQKFSFCTSGTGIQDPSA